MDPVTLAVATSGLSFLAVECIKGAASEAGKNLWNGVKSLFDWQAEPDLDGLAERIARRLAENDEAARRAVELIASSPDVGTASLVVSGSITGKNVITGTNVSFAGEVKMS